MLRDQTGGVLVVELSLRSKLIAQYVYSGLCPQAPQV